VVDAVSGEALARIAVRGCGAAGTVTGPDGRFRFEAPNGECTLQIGGVGYRPFTMKVEVTATPTPEYEIG
jgi:hypothetical protein